MDVAIRAAYGSATAAEPLFAGSIVGHHLRVWADGRATVTVECRGAAPVVPAAGALPTLKAAWGTGILHVQVGARAGDAAGVHGRVKLPGTAAATVGGLIELVGLGRRFAGPVGILAVTHDIGPEGWVTEVAFGAQAASLPAR